MANPDQELPPESESIVDRIASSGHALTRVLAVDDELAASKLLSIILGPPDYYCATASNGEEALLALHLTYARILDAVESLRRETFGDPGNPGVKPVRP